MDPIRFFTRTSSSAATWRTSIFSSKVILPRTPLSGQAQYQTHLQPHSRLKHRLLFQKYKNESPSSSLKWSARKELRVFQRTDPIVGELFQKGFLSTRCVTPFDRNSNSCVLEYISLARHPFYGGVFELRPERITRGARGRWKVEAIPCCALDHLVHIEGRRLCKQRNIISMTQ